MSKKILSVILAIFMLVSAMAVMGVSASADEAPAGENYTYYFYAPAKWFTTNDSIGIYYWTPAENAAWPGAEVTKDNCVFTAEDGSRVYKVQVWQADADTQGEKITTPVVIFNSFVDASKDAENGHQTSNLNVEGYWEGDVDKLVYGEGFPKYDSKFTTPNFNNMIYVPDPSQISTNDYSGATEIKGGVWYYYWGDGKYGTTKTDPNAVVSTPSTNSTASTDSTVSTEAPTSSDTKAPVTGDTTSILVIVLTLTAAAAVVYALRKKVTE